MALKDDLVSIAGGRVEAIGPAASLRLQAREGLFHLLPAPAHLLLLRDARADGEARSCRLAGELTAPGNIVDILGYAAYALFLSRPQVSRAQQARPDLADSAAEAARLSQRVAALLEPIDRQRTKRSGQ
jgi:hypothetical protein